MDDTAEVGGMRKSRALSKRALMLAGICAPLPWLTLSPEVAHGQQAANMGAKPFVELTQTYCVKCHNTTDWAGGWALDAVDLSQAGQDPELWEKAVGKLRGRLMPPAGQTQPAQADVDALVDYLETSLDSAEKEPRVGHVPIERLNRAEFAASVRQLVGVEVDPKQVLPADIAVEGFTNIAGALGISPSFMEQYLSAARRVARLAVGEPAPKVARVFSGGGGGGGGQAGPGSPSQLNHKDGYPLGTRGGVSFTHVFPADGEYRFNFMDGDSVDAGLYPRGMETTATLVLLVDGKEVARRQLGGPEDLTLADRDGPKGRTAIVAKISGIPVQIKAGEHTVTATFIERSWAESNDPTGAGRTFGIGMPIIRDGVQVVGPYSPQGLSLSASRAKIFICEPTKPDEERPCAERIARHLATQAFRRPVTGEDVKWLMRFYENGRNMPGGFDSGITELVTAVLSSPDFLYRAISSPSSPGQTRELTDLELATRLSFFLWNQGPDAQLLTLAEHKQLSSPPVLDAQVARMLKDPRAESLVTEFAFSWLNFGTLRQIEPLDREFTADMRTNFETEARLFLSS